MRESNYKQRQFLLDKKNNIIVNEMIAKIASGVFIIISVIYPFFMGLEGYTDLTFDKALFFWIATGVAVAALLFMFVCIKEKFSMDNYYIENEPRRKTTVAEWVLVVFLIWTFISAVLSMLQNPEWANPGFGSASVWFGANDRYDGFISFLCYAVTFTIIARFYKIKHLHLQLLAVSVILVSLIGVLQLFGLDIFGLYPATNDFEPLSAHFRTTLGNVNLVSSYCSFAIILFAALFTVSRSKWQYLYLGAGAFSFALSLTASLSGNAHKVAILGSMILLIPYWLSNRERLARILIVLSSWCIVYAGHSAYMSAMKRQYEAGALFPEGDRQLLSTYANKNIPLILIIAVVLLVAGFALILLIKKWHEKAMKITGIILLLVIFISGLLGLEIIGSKFSDQPDNIIWQAREMMHGRVDDSFGSNRGWIWRNAMEVIPDNPIFGTGPDTFYHALGSERQMEAFERDAYMHDKAHNIFLQIAVCMGIPALIAYLIFLGSIFIPAIQQAFERPILFAFGSAALSYIIQSFFSIEGPIVTPLLWIALGVMASEIWMAKIGYKSMEV